MLKEDEVLIREGIFWLSAKEGEKVRLFGGKCHSCGEVTFPAKERCPMCDTGEKMENL